MITMYSIQKEIVAATERTNGAEIVARVSYDRVQVVRNGEAVTGWLSIEGALAALKRI